jgi:hypothetical protein
MSAEYVCHRCGGVQAVGRRENHERYWCVDSRCSDSGSGSGSESGGDSDRGRTDGGVSDATDLASRLTLADFTRPAFHSTCSYSVVHLPLELHFEQQSIFGPADTGGSLWFAELLLAEYLVTEIGRSPPGRPGTVLELGCGAAPASGMCALALNYDVVFSDLAVILPFAKRNLELNSERVKALRTGPPNSAGSSVPTGKPPSVDFLELDWTEPLPQRVADLSPFSLVTCSDCLFRTSFHRPLACTLAALLAAARGAGAGGATQTKILVAFQLRSPEDLLFFDELAPVGLQAAQVDIKHLLSLMKWPAKGGASSEGEGAGAPVNLHENIFLYSLSPLSSGKAGAS